MLREAEAAARLGEGLAEEIEHLEGLVERMGEQTERRGRGVFTSNLQVITRAEAAR